MAPLPFPAVVRWLPVLLLGRKWLGKVQGLRLVSVPQQIEFVRRVRDVILVREGPWLMCMGNFLFLVVCDGSSSY